MPFNFRAKSTRFLVLVAVFTLIVYTFRERISDGSFYNWESYSSDASVTQGGYFDWSKLPVRYPVSSLHPLPTGAPLKLPKVQHVFSQESAAEKASREERREAVRDVFIRDWKSYKKYAWMADELVSRSIFPKA